MSYCTYIMASRKGGALYIGVTSDLVKRVWQHKQSVEGFTARYNIKKLVYFELYDDVSEAILRETRLKTWKRQWKVELIESSNKEWRDLYETIV